MFIYLIQYPNPTKSNIQSNSQPILIPTNIQFPTNPNLIQFLPHTSSKPHPNPNPNPNPNYKKIEK